MFTDADVNRWLLDAEDEAPGDTEAQIAWLREQRKIYSQSVRDGDWETLSGSDAGGSGTHKRGVSDRDNHDAIVAALARLGATDRGAGGTLLHVRFGNVLN